jgi:hypothetical protein
MHGSLHDLPCTYLCNDTVPLDQSTCWQVAAAKLNLLERQAHAVRTEAELSECLDDKACQGRLFQTAQQFREAVGYLCAASTTAHIESIMQHEPAPDDAPPPEQTAQQDQPRAAAWSGTPGQEHARLILPTCKQFANMWQMNFWQEWNPMDWCYGDCLYGDPRLNENPYKRTSFQDWCKHIHLREELEYDMYSGGHYGQDHWQQQLNVVKLLAEFDQSLRTEARDPQTCIDAIFEVNRFRRNHACRMVLATFWRLMSGFVAVNVGLKITGVQRKLKALAELPELLQILSAKSSNQDGMASLIRRAVHLFDLITGKVVGSNGPSAFQSSSVYRMHSC